MSGQLSVARLNGAAPPPWIDAEPWGESHEKASLADGADHPSPPRPDEPGRQIATTEGAWTRHVVEAPPAWYRERPPTRSWLLRDARHPKARGVLPLGKVGQLIAEGGIGKTMVACQLAVSVAVGARFLGAFDVASPGRVLLVLAEEDLDEAQRRLFHAVTISGADPPEAGAIVVLPLYGITCSMLELDSTGNLLETSFLHWIREYIAKSDFRLVVFDPLTRFAGPKAEVDNAAGTRFVQALESLAAPNRFILNAHHVNKISRGKDGRLDASSGRGSSSLVDGARWQCALGAEELPFEDEDERERLGEVVTFAVTKSNYSRKPAALTLRRHSDHLGALVPLDDHDIGLVEAARQRTTLRTPKAEARKAEGATRDAAQDVAVLRIVAEAPGITWRKLCERVAALTGCGDWSARKAIERATGRLIVRPGAKRALTYFPLTGGT